MSDHRLANPEPATPRAIISFMQSGRYPEVKRVMRVLALFLMVYGSALILLQLGVPQKMVRAAMGYGGWVWGGFSDLPTAWTAPTDVDAALDWLYAALSLHTPLLPWAAWVAGALLLLPAIQPAEDERGEASASNLPARERTRTIYRLAAWGVALLALGLGAWLRVGNLLPSEGGLWPGSNYDEMVYYTEAELLTRAVWAYRDAFMAHPPGVILAFSPALVFERAWGGAAAFIAARQWLLAYSLLAVPLVWLAGRRLGGELSGALAALALSLDAKAAFAPQSDRRLPNVGVLETLANLTSLGAFALYLYAPPTGRARRIWLLASGAVAGISALCKVPALAMLAALVVYSLVRRRSMEAVWLLLGGAVGAGVLALPFFLAAPGQMVRQALFFQLLRPQEVREGIDQAARIASYPEAQFTLLLAGVGLAVITLLFWYARRQRLNEAAQWLLPALWAAPVIATFTLSRSYHSQYYTQLVPPLALVASALAASQVWQRRSALKVGSAALLALFALPLLISQWRAGSSAGYDEVYRRMGDFLAGRVRAGEQVMAYDPGYTFAAGLPPARVPLADGGGLYLVDTAGYTVYTAEEMDRQPWGALLERVFSFGRERNEPEVLARPEAQAVLLSGALGADWLVLDQKIALPKLTAQSVKLLEARAEAQEEIGFATALHAPTARGTAAPPFPLALAAATLARLDADITPALGPGTLTVSPQDALQVGLYWRPLDYPSADLRVVVRFESEAGANVRQVDTEPAEGTARTTLWRPGFVYPDIRNIPLAGLRPGTYRVLVRIYDPVSGVSSREIPLQQAVEVR